MVPLDPVIFRSVSFVDPSSVVKEVKMTDYHRSNSNANGRSQSEPFIATLDEGFDEGFDKPKRRISFDERVMVRQYERNSWMNVTDMAELSPMAGGGKKLVTVIPQFIAFPTTSQDSGCYDESCDSTTSTATNSSLSAAATVHNMLRREVHCILMVDPHDIFLTLFSKRWQEALPHVTIVTAHSSDEALQVVSKQTFDIIVVEERLSLFHRQHRGANNKLTSGSALISHLKRELHHQPCLLIGVTAHWQSDHATMAQSGADFCWPKAPGPTFRNNRALLEELLHTLLLKRGKHQMASELMLAASVSMETLSAEGEEGVDVDGKQ